MRAKSLPDLLRKGDRVAVSNITGREAGKVTEISQRYAGNVIGGWALGRGGGAIPVEQQSSLPVFSDYTDLLEHLPAERHPNKIVIYSPPEAVYGEIKNVVKASVGVETIFIITEHVSIEVSAKIRKLCEAENIDVPGCNTLGVINATEQVRIGAVGGDAPEETFHPGGATILSNSGNIPSPYKEQIEQFHRTQFGRITTRRDMRNASHASSNDGTTPRIYGHSVLRLMESHTFAHTLILAWTGHPPARPFEPELVEKTLIAAVTNGPGTMSAQAAKLSASAGNSPHTAMIATLAAIGDVHGGNGKEAVAFMIDAFANSALTDPYDAASRDLVRRKAHQVAEETLRSKRAASEQDMAFQRVPCLGHPVYRNEEANRDPREQIIAAHLETIQVYHAFLDFYHELAAAMRQVGATRNVLAVNVDAAIACVWLGICWPLLCEKRLTAERAKQIAVAAFALGRAAGGAGEYFDHAEFGQPMDMRIPVSECTALTQEEK